MCKPRTPKPSDAKWQVCGMDFCSGFAFNYFIEASIHGGRGFRWTFKTCLSKGMKSPPAVNLSQLERINSEHVEDTAALTARD